MKLFECQHCGQPLYFENIRCESCGRSLGYLPAAETISALEEGKRGLRALAERKGRYRYCANSQFGTCNWLVSVDSPEQFCAACRHNRMIPDLSLPENQANWRKIELAKHRLFYTLLKLRLPLQTKLEDPEHGLAFDFLAAPPPNSAPPPNPVMTGHDNGLITINLAEADDSERERMRSRDGRALPHLARSFPPRDRALLLGSPGRRTRPASKRSADLFGDEREDYGAALQRHYANGPPPDWQQHFVTRYASTHPWEDWAETWAHYFHMVDTLETASAFGMRVRPRVTKGADLSTAIDFDPHSADLDRIVDSWLPLTFAVNSINRSMGIADLYPFVLAPPVIVKLSFIHDRIHQAAGPRRLDQGRGALRAVIASMKRGVVSPDQA